jgi:hypothetical protein
MESKGKSALLRIMLVATAANMCDGENITYSDELGCATGSKCCSVSSHLMQLHCIRERIHLPGACPMCSTA